MLDLVLCHAGYLVMFLSAGASIHFFVFVLYLLCTMYFVKYLKRRYFVFRFE